jgi:hypothetical protein
MPLWTILTDLLREPSRLLAVFWYARHRRHGRRLRDMFLPSISEGVGTNPPGLGADHLPGE